MPPEFLMSEQRVGCVKVVLPKKEMTALSVAIQCQKVLRDGATEEWPLVVKVAMDQHDNQDLLLLIGRGIIRVTKEIMEKELRETHRAATVPPTVHSTYSHATHPEPDLDRDPLHQRPPVPPSSTSSPALSTGGPRTHGKLLLGVSSSQGRAPGLCAASSLPSPSPSVTVVVAVRPSAPQRCHACGRFSRGSTTPSSPVAWIPCPMPPNTLQQQDSFLDGNHAE
ncbi:uncharacterized protein LOC125532728 [Triticum urartu]|uniref:uncharacterized protein LOC125532728 n=1 Tax=Triticum urartu TaxID=4572 RepID=UPI00204369AA|nr:uncharacterized protein LOC125532728 [Triticum urartu]